MFGLSPDDVDFLRGTVQIGRQVKLLAGNRLHLGLPRGNKTRTVPIPSALRDLLAAHLVERPSRSVTLPWRELDAKPVTVGLVLTSRERRALNRNHFNQYVWHRAVESAGLPMGRENGMHALRHHYASVLPDAGESIKAVSSFLGHSDAGFTLRTYTHPLPSSDERTRQAVDAAFGCYVTVAIPVQDHAV